MQYGEKGDMGIWEERECGNKGKLGEMKCGNKWEKRGYRKREGV